MVNSNKKYMVLVPASPYGLSSVVLFVVGVCAVGYLCGRVGVPHNMFLVGLLIICGLASGMTVQHFRRLRISGFVERRKGINHKAFNEIWPYYERRDR